MTIDGIDVVDAMSDWPLLVNDDHIAIGVPMDKEKCPGAVACKRGIPGAEKAQVYKSRVFVLKQMWIEAAQEKQLRWERYMVPNSLMIQEAVIDNGGRFQPGTYILKAPPKNRRTGRQQGSNTRPDPSLPRRIMHITPMRPNAPTAST